MMLKKAYLLAYNGSMLAGWTVILAKVLKHLLSGGDVRDVYPLISKLLVIFQSGAMMEVLHAMLGLVNSSVSTTFLQVLSRVLVVYGTLEIGPTASRESPLFTQMVTAWSVSELIRYSYYALNLLGVKCQPLTWLRYSAFTVLYPLGISGEIGCFYKALPYIKENKPWTVEMPNRYNFTFSYYHTVWFILLGLYPLGSYTLYSYMLGQRRKVLGSAAAGTAGGNKNVTNGNHKTMKQKQ
ncbi:protein tyrosine phosphatase [Trypanosoma theileri]|uniref:very-long-chain (3R)-3-hydroxyacyl-CoA dehydratase n=1 Tax=Trypanosoma theileri TaxID=67003 RepID=A0A1X0P0I0_9TRYP|nr:protein tyrosine phosphatase [Trypanosoma theileri]ORC90444.1 protein tyrosine phosphatase [Trypanosoma theileri]